MPTVRKRRSRQRVEIDLDLARMHIETGDCCLAGEGRGCFCGLRDFDGNESDDLIEQVKARMKESGDAGGIVA
ncbi:MAG: hypothetical protein WC681_14280 [Sterolibacterium sp.]|jgi:hypothetical protein